VKGHKKFIILFSLVFVLYIIAELNKPKQLDWTVTLSKNDKNPFGGYVVYEQLENIFPSVRLQSYRMPLYDQLNNVEEQNTAYLILSPDFKPSQADFDEMKKYVAQGNYVMISAANFAKSFLDSFKLKTSSRLSFLGKDSTSINFVNPALKTVKDFTFHSSTIDEYFSQIDTANTTVLGINDRKQPNFIKAEFGEGAFFLHSAPICFSNYFMLSGNNADYVAKALSYIPAEVDQLYWDEFYKLGPAGAATPLRLFLSNSYLLWALRLAVAGLLIYIFFEIKRRQRVIPVINPLRNSSLDFIKTVSNVYFNQGDNAGIADKKITYFLEFLRQRFFLHTKELDSSFVEQLSRKSGVSSHEITDLVNILGEVKSGYPVSDKLLVVLDQRIDNFYKQV
jgi:hypothetical protein